MTTMKRLVFFFALAFPLSWYPWIIALLKGTTSGPNPLGPLVAALIVIAITEGRTGIKDFLKRLVRWRVGVRWYAVVFLLPVFCCLVAAGIALATGAQLQSATKDSNAPSDLLPKFVFILLFIGLGEEPGWRGYALEKLQKLYSPFKSSLILAPIWALWHLPLMGSEFATPIIPAFLLSVVGATIALTVVYNGAQRSILLPMLLHATVNTIGSGFVFQMFRPQDLTSLWYIYAVVWFATSMAATFLLKNTKSIVSTVPTPASI
ncbi:CPBP family intramembrane metalloprotease [bacterium]|nr:CPBP family intramembrane metalloprotease [bacterium]